MRFTGERIHPDDPDFQPDVSQHMAAYHYCLGFASEKTVLDGGCGEGYGARYLAEAARCVVGVDVSLAAVRRAGLSAPSNLYLTCGNLLRLGFQEASFDIVCSFQVLEHFHRPGDLLHEASRVLRSSGMLLLTTPNRLTSFSENPYHVKEYRPEELRELIEPIFPSVEILGIFGSPRVKMLQSSRRRHVTGILSLDPLGLRHALPPSIQKWAFAKLARWVRWRIRAEHRESFTELAAPDFTVGGENIDESMDLLAICRK